MCQEYTIICDQTEWNHKCIEHPILSNDRITDCMVWETQYVTILLVFLEQ